MIRATAEPLLAPVPAAPVAGLWLLLVALSGLFASPSALALQAPGFGSNDSSAGRLQLVNESAVREDATAAFRHGVGRLRSKYPAQDAVPFDLEATVASQVAAYEQALELELLRLQQDGLLTSGEVSDRLGRLSRARLANIEAVFQAAAAGVGAPPNPWSQDDTFNYASAVAGYVLFQRNGAMDWLVLLASLCAGAVLGWLGSRGVKHGQLRLLRHDLDQLSVLVGSMVAPLYLAMITAGLAVGLRWIWLPMEVSEFLHACVDSALVLAVFWFLWHACAPVANLVMWTIRATYADHVDGQAFVVLRRSLRVVLALGFMLLLVRWVWQTNFAAVFAGLGLLGLALTLVLRSMVQNVFASFTIFAEQHFRVGDILVVEDTWGVVEDVGFRSTALRTLDGYLWHIPNNTLVEGVIRNISARPFVRRRFRLQLSHRDAPAVIRQALELVKQVLVDHPPEQGYPDDQPPRVVLEDLGPWDASILVQYHFQPADYWLAKEFDSATNLRLLDTLGAEDIKLAFPSQTEEHLEAVLPAGASAAAERTAGVSGE